ncbi:MAG: histidine kinase [Oscillospiraceae bacterium]|nr:histidine kinase [Oscillospiraceae bacterium]
MIFVTSYNYSQTRTMLIEQAYSDMRQNMNTIENSINLMLQPYETITRTIESDRTLNLLLNVDYTDQSYGDLAYYCRTTLDNILALYPSVNWLRFYSGNTTLPKDNYYFFRLEHLHQDAAELADSRKGYVVAAGGALNNNTDDIILLSRINYYASNVFKNYLLLSIMQETVATQLRQEREGWSVYLLDSQGLILSSSSEENIGNNYQSIWQEWETIPVGQIQEKIAEDGTEFFHLRADLNMGMVLTMTVNQDQLLQSTKKIPQRALAGFLLLTLLAFLHTFVYSRVYSERLRKIVETTGKIGQGQFDSILEDGSRDELGQIAAAVNQMNKQINTLIQENYERQLRIKSSEMNLLQEQINPHFLYNALGVVSSMALREGSKKTVQSVRYLADFYRMSLSRGRQTITVEEELALLRSYMNIQLIRFSDTLEINYDTDPAVASWQTIKLILQPLVENAIHHGQQEEQVLHITVRTGCKNGRLFYEVEDDGAGISPEKLETLQTELAALRGGFGLKNVDIRIKLNYGEDYGVQLTSVLGHGTKVHVEIPGIQPVQAEQEAAG